MSGNAGTQNHLMRGSAVFISASIPDPGRWEGGFDPFGITDAVVAVARAVLQNGGRLVTAAHPTIAPLLLYVGAEQLEEKKQQITVYQSAAFEPILPDATKRYERDGLGSITWTGRIKNEPADPALATKSLEHMRKRMLTETTPVAAVFVGGMTGISDEYRLFRQLRPTAPTYAFGCPGGEAQTLVDKSPARLQAELTKSKVYPTVARHIVDDVIQRLGKGGGLAVHGET